MPYFLNRNFKNNEFELVSKDRFFVEETNMIKDISSLIGVKDRFICITRPWRFGKTINAMMLTWYYSKNADFKKLFDKLEISKSEPYLEHLNKIKNHKVKIEEINLTITYRRINIGKYWIRRKFWRNW